MARSVAMLCILVVALVGHDAWADRRKLVVVVAKGSSLTSVSRSDLKHCFTGDSISGDGRALVPFNAEAKTPERTGFDRSLLGMSPDEVGRFWVDRKIRGQSSAPRSLPSSAHIVKVVAKFPGAIGYVLADQITAELQPVRIDGLAYTDPAYPLFSD